MIEQNNNRRFNYKQKIKVMTINLTPQESEEYFYNALCNGQTELHYYDLELDWDDADYKEAKISIKQPDMTVCYEDILMEMLRNGKTLWVVDNNDEERHPITLQLIHERVQKTPHIHLMNMINEHDDAITADVILQTVIYDEIIYG